MQKTLNRKRIYDISWIIPLLEERPIDSTTFKKLLEDHGVPGTQGVLRSFLYQIGNNYPLYEPADGVYKILTKKDLENYENRKRKTLVGAN